MAKLKVQLSIGYPTAIKKDSIDIDIEDFEDMTDEQKNDALYCIANEWAQNHIDISYEVID